MDLPQVTFALGIPHCPWVAARAQSLDRIVKSIDVSQTHAYRVFDEQAPNWKWSRDMWQWGACSGATHFVQLQDDVVPCPNFWARLRAMVSQASGYVIGMQGAHPKFRQLAREESRWARSHAWMVGVGYVIPITTLVELVAYREVNDVIAQSTNEDDFISRFCMQTSKPILHPIPTLIDHDTAIESTYGNDAHLYRRPTVTWELFGDHELADPAFWKLPTVIPMITNPHLERCWLCENEPASVGYGAGVRLGRKCIKETLNRLVDLGTGARE